MKYRPKERPTFDAWQYDPKAPMPIWVFKKCHKLSDGEDLLTCRIVFGALVQAKPGDWIIRYDEDGNVITMSNEEFTADFEPVPAEEGAKS